MVKAWKKYFKALNKYAELVESFELEARAGIHNSRLHRRLSRSLDQACQAKCALLTSLTGQKWFCRMAAHYSKLLDGVFNRHMSAYDTLRRTRQGK